MATAMSETSVSPTLATLDHQTGPVAGNGVSGEIMSAVNNALPAPTPTPKEWVLEPGTFTQLPERSY